MYSYFSLIVRNVQEKRDFDLLRSALMELDLHGYVFDEGGYYYTKHEAEFPPYDSQEWTDMEEDMGSLSMIFPQMVFKVNMRCDDGDLADYYFQNGKCEYCPGRVVYEKPKEIAWEEKP